MSKKPEIIPIRKPKPRLDQSAVADFASKPAGQQAGKPASQQAGDTKKVTVRMPAPLAKRLAIAAIERDMTQRDLILSAVEAYLADD